MTASTAPRRPSRSAAARDAAGASMDPKLDKATARKAAPKSAFAEVAAENAALAAAEAEVVEKAVSRRGPAKTGNPATDRQANAAKAAKAKAAPKAKAKATPAPNAPRAKVAPKLPNGYAVRYENGAYDLAKRGEGAAEGGPEWIVICTAHGTTTTAPKAKDGDALGRKTARPGWCKKCAAEATAK